MFVWASDEAPVLTRKLFVAVRSFIREEMAIVTCITPSPYRGYPLEDRLLSTPLGRYCADPNLVVFDGRYFLYCTDDGVEDWGSTAFSVYVSDDLHAWERFPVLDLHDVPWWRGEGGAWAPSAIRRGDGTYIFYFVADAQIGAAVGGSPYGPFQPLGKPMVSLGEFSGNSIDPGVFVDDDGTRYFLWGNDVAHCVRLNPDCASFEPAAVDSWVPGDFREAIWVHKHAGVYYASWSENDTRDPEYCVKYAMSPSIHGPWKECGVLLQQNPCRGVVGTGHHSILNIPGTDEWVVAYHRFALHSGNGNHREIVFAPLEYLPDGRLAQVRPQTGSYVRPLGISM